MAVLYVAGGVVGLESLAIKPTSVYALLTGFPSVPLEDFRALVYHSSLELVNKLILAWEPDYQSHTPSGDAAMGQAVMELATRDYVPDGAINWE